LRTRSAIHHLAGGLRQTEQPVVALVHQAKDDIVIALFDEFNSAIQQFFRRLPSYVRDCYP
jgi:hypothetical protein